jgi:2-polyprenyl-3-methyl-5-hydroxy-6-metoxy-1,4-benzoquinol methylase
MVFVSPILREERLHSHYLDEDSWNQVLANPVQSDIDRKKFTYGLDLIEHYGTERGSLLDIGAGMGGFLKVAKSRGWQVQAIEFNSLCVRHLESLGIPTTVRPIDACDLPDQSIDCVTMWDVLEHLAEPRPALEASARALTNGGLLMVAIPNINGLATRLLWERNSTFCGHSHVNFFSPRTLTAILQQSGFELIEIETLLTELGTINNYLDYQDPYLGSASTILPCLTPEFIHRHMVGSRILALARRAVH